MQYTFLTGARGFVDLFLTVLIYTAIVAIVVVVVAVVTVLADRKFDNFTWSWRFHIDFVCSFGRRFGR